MSLKKIIGIMLAVSMLATMFTATTFADDEKIKVYLEDTAVYEVERGVTEIVVPIYASGEIDMQCFDITVTYDRSALTLVEEKTGIFLEEGEYTYTTTNAATLGIIRFTGITTEESAKAKSGKIGELVFTSAKRITKDGVTTELGLSVDELGFGTEVDDLDITATATITLNKSEDPNPPVSVELGNVNGDDVIDASDALAILKHAAQLELLDGDALIAADANEDGTVDANDALDVLKFAAQILDHLGK